MANFSEALELLKKGQFVKREVIKNDTVIGIYKNRLYQVSLYSKIRYPYVPTNNDLMADDWMLVSDNWWF